MCELANSTVSELANNEKTAKKQAARCAGYSIGIVRQYPSDSSMFLGYLGC